MSDSCSARPRVGLIGISGYAQIYIDLLLEEKNATRFNLVAVTVIPSEQQLEIVARIRALNIRIYDSFDAFIEGERGQLDLCIIPTGIHWHARMTIAALNSGANVLVEKPLAGSFSDAESIIQAEKTSGRWVAVGFQDIYTQELKWLKEQLLNNAIGHIQSVRMIGLWPRSAAYYNRTYWAGRLFIDNTAALDSPLNNAFAHFVNLAIHLTGPQLHTSGNIEISDAELFRAHSIESFDTAVVTAKNTQGTRFWFGVSHACSVYREPEIIIQGESGHAEWFHDRHCLIEPRSAEPTRYPLPTYETTRQCMIDAIFARLQDPTANICDTGIAICHTRFIQDLHNQYPIHTLAPQNIERRRIPGHANEIPAIRDIEDHMDHAFQNGSMLRETSFTPIPHNS